LVARVLGKNILVLNLLRESKTNSQEKELLKEENYE